MTKKITHDKIETVENGKVVYTETRAQVLEELRGCRMDNDYGVCYKNAAEKIRLMNAAK